MVVVPVETSNGVCLLPLCDTTRHPNPPRSASERTFYLSASTPESRQLAYLRAVSRLLKLCAIPSDGAVQGIRVFESR